MRDERAERKLYLARQQLKDDRSFAMAAASDVSDVSQLMELNGCGNILT